MRPVCGAPHGTGETMPNRHTRRDEARGPEPRAPRPRGGRRSRAQARLRGRWGVAALLLVLLLVASLAPTGQASGGRSSGEREAQLAAKQAEREQRAAAREAERTAARERREAGHSPSFVTGGPKDEQEKEHGKVTVDCTQVVWEFSDFPATGLNTVNEVVTIRDQHPPQSLPTTFSFRGSAARQVTPIVGGPGRYLIDASSHWKTNGLKGGFDIHLKVICPAEPALTIEKLQRIGGSANSFVSSPLTGSVGETVDYEMLVKNTGNVPLTLEDFSDPNCDAGTISGGPGEGASLAVGASTTYLCEHLLDRADEAVGRYEN